PALAEPVFDARSIVIESTRLEIACHGGGQHARCSFEARYRIRNEAAEGKHVVAVVHAAHLVPVVTNEGHSALPIPVSRVGDPSAAQTRQDLDTYDDFFVTKTYAFLLDFDGHDTRTVVVRADLDIPLFVELFGPSCEVAGIRQRH